jgi:integrase
MFLSARRDRRTGDYEPLTKSGVELAQVLGHSSRVMIQRTYAHSTPSDAHELMAKLLAD